MENNYLYATIKELSDRNAELLVEKNKLIYQNHDLLERLSQLESRLKPVEREEEENVK